MQAVEVHEKKKLLLFIVILLVIWHCRERLSTQASCLRSYKAAAVAIAIESALLAAVKTGVAEPGEEAVAPAGTLGIVG